MLINILSCLQLLLVMIAIVTSSERGSFVRNFNTGVGLGKLQQFIARLWSHNWIVYVNAGQLCRSANQF